tara:strand:- start:23231 stop:23818 length:588 start_codon:yes stop_codon:yes gene_type:complete
MALYSPKKLSIRLVAALCLFALLQMNHAYSQNMNILESISACQQIDDLSFRLACYDRLFPPGAGASRATASNAAADIPSRVPPAPSNATPVINAPASTPSEAPATAPLEERSIVERILQPQQADSVIQIVNVEQIDLRNSRLVSSDGTVFLQTNATTITRWPATPFNVEIQRSLTGTIFLVFPERNQRIRVSVAE